MSGLTAMQMKHAPRDSLYVWVKDSSIRYARDLAISLQRTDLTIIAAGQLDYRLYGRRFGGLVIDHALAGKLTSHQRETLDRLRAFIRPQPEVLNAT